MLPINSQPKAHDEQSSRRMRRRWRSFAFTAQARVLLWDPLWPISSCGRRLGHLHLRCWPEQARQILQSQLGVHSIPAFRIMILPLLTSYSKNSTSKVWTCQSRKSWIPLHKWPQWSASCDRNCRAVWRAILSILWQQRSLHLPNDRRICL